MVLFPIGDPGRVLPPWMCAGGGPPSGRAPRDACSKTPTPPCAPPPAGSRRCLLGWLAKALLALGPQRARATSSRLRGGGDRPPGQALSKQGIARRSGIAEETVEAHRTRVFEHIGVADRLEAALWAQTRRASLDSTGLQPLSL